MTQIIYQKDCLQAIGHAQSKCQDYDLVCCAISTIMYTCPSWFKKKEINFLIDEKNTATIIQLTKPYSPQSVNKLHLAYLQLEALSKKYPQYIKIKKI